MLRRRWPAAVRCGATILLLALVQAPAFAAGFAINEHGSRAMGMGGAATAQAEDGSVMFFNVGGLAFLREKQYNVGLTVIQVASSELDGLAPFPGLGYSAAVEEKTFLPPHFYYVRPLGERFTFGFGLYAPFGLAVEWKDPARFAGRYISTNSEIRAFDLNPSIGYRVSDNFGVGFGLIGRFSDVALDRYVPFVNPFSNTVVDVATVGLESDFDSGLGWDVGVLHKVGKYFSWGLSYRSNLTIEYSGDATFDQISTGNPVLDGLVGQALPVGQTIGVETEIEFPDTASFGVALGLTERLLVELDVNWIGWSSFDVLPITFPSRPDLSSLRPQNWDDTYTYRAGLEFKNGRRAWRLGILYDESPQPEEGVGPLLPDADRTGFTLGYGNQRFDVALMYLDLAERSTTTNLDGFFGTYKTEVWLFGGTVKF